jgi:hypothetical protein
MVGGELAIYTSQQLQQDREETTLFFLWPLPFSLHLTVLSPFCNNEYYDTGNNTHNNDHLDMTLQNARSSNEAWVSHTNLYPCFSSFERYSSCGTTMLRYLSVYFEVPLTLTATLDQGENVNGRRNDEDHDNVEGTRSIIDITISVVDVVVIILIIDSDVQHACRVYL